MDFFVRDFFRVNFLKCKSKENAKIHAQKIHKPKFTIKKIHLAKFTPKSTPQFKAQNWNENFPNNPCLWLEMTPDGPETQMFTRIRPPGPIETRNAAVLLVHLAEEKQMWGGGVSGPFPLISVQVDKHIMTKCAPPQKK